jgi:hypothetical protein
MEVWTCGTVQYGTQSPFVAKLGRQCRGKDHVIESDDMKHRPVELAEIFQGNEDPAPFPPHTYLSQQSTRARTQPHLLLHPIRTYVLASYPSPSSPIFCPFF